MRESEPYIERDTLDVIIYILTFTSDCSLSFFLSSSFAHIVYTRTNENKSHVALLLQLPLTKPPPPSQSSYILQVTSLQQYNSGSTRKPNDSEEKPPSSSSSSSAN